HSPQPVRTSWDIQILAGRRFPCRQDAGASSRKEKELQLWSREGEAATNSHHLSVNKIGSEPKLRVDQPHIARSEGDAPDVDARVVLSEPALVGEFIRRTVTGSRGYDLLA